MAKWKPGDLCGSLLLSERKNVSKQEGANEVREDRGCSRSPARSLAARHGWRGAEEEDAHTDYHDDKLDQASSSGTNADLISDYLHSPARPSQQYTPGDLLKQFFPDKPSRPRSRSCSRSSSPAPKRMPRRPQPKAAAPQDPPRDKAQPSARPSASRVQLLSARPKVPARGSVLMAIRPKARASAPSRVFRPSPSQQTVDLHESWRQQQEEAGSFIGRLAGGGSRDRLSMEVLARHSARLGPSTAKGLEDAVRRAVEQASDPEAAEPWNFLESQHGLAAFQAAKSACSAIYKRSGYTGDADLEVRRQLGTESFIDLLGDEAIVPFRAFPPAPPPKPEDGPGEKGDLMLLPIGDVRFAHNNQSEHFVHGDGDCSVLQLAVELISGLTPLEAVPLFTVCRHADQWYCRSGNRRLAALYLAALFSPERFHCVWVRRVKADAAFLHASRPGGRPKLTTHLNGADCEGQWLFIKETDEAVGSPGLLDRPPYGADLLSLLPRTCSEEAESDGSAGGA